MTVTINGTTGVAGVDGTASTPAIQGNDTNTGIFFPAADTIAFAEGGAEVARFDSNGNLGVGTSSPSVKLQLQGSVAQDQYLVNTSVSVGSKLGGAYFYSSATSNGWYSGVESYVPSGSPGIDRTDLRFFTTSVTPSERMRIDSSGNLLVGRTTQIDFGKLCLNYSGATNNGIIFDDTTSSGTTSACIFKRATTNVGAINTTASATSYVTSSDYRLKENIAPMTGALAKVALLKPVTYTWKADGSDGQGFIAHELQEVVPDCVVGEKDAVNEDGTIKAQGIDTSFLVATLTAAIQELKAEVDTVKTELATLKGQA